jgi:hypothetical protein
MEELATKFKLVVSSGNLVATDVEIFRAGDYPQGKWSADMVARVAENYDKSWIAAPITLDHVQEGPAYGWVDSLRAEDGVLYADLEITEAAFRMIDEKTFPNRSVELYKSFELRSGDRGPYLKALSLLGAAQPAVPGMAPIDLSPETFSAIIYTTQEGDQMPENQNEPPTVDVAEFRRLQQDRDELQAEVSALKLKAYRAEQSSLLEHTLSEFTAKGLPIPAIRQELVEIYHALPANDEIRSRFLEMIGKIPAVVNTSSRFSVPAATAPVSGDWFSEPVQTRVSELQNEFLRKHPDGDLEKYTRELRQEFREKGTL